ncbi:MAG: nuclear transport factor 2 family protein [Terracidiphilus sp.]|jgi:ketosteroid isomerase-like protein
MPGRTPDVSADSVLAAIALERDAMESGNIDRYLALLTDDAIFMPPNSPSKTGGELRSWLRGFLEGFPVEWLSFVSTETLIAGEMAFHSYTYTWRVCARAGGEPTIATGKGCISFIASRTDRGRSLARFGMAILQARGSLDAAATHVN